MRTPLPYVRLPESFCVESLLRAVCFLTAPCPRKRPDPQHTTWDPAPARRPLFQSCAVLVHRPDSRRADQARRRGARHHRLGRVGCQPGAVQPIGASWNIHGHTPRRRRRCHCQAVLHGGKVPDRHSRQEPLEHSKRCPCKSRDYRWCCTNVWDDTERQSPPERRATGTAAVHSPRLWPCQPGNFPASGGKLASLLIHSPHPHADRASCAFRRAQNGGFKQLTRRRSRLARHTDTASMLRAGG